MLPATNAIVRHMMPRLRHGLAPREHLDVEVTIADDHDAIVLRMVRLKLDRTGNTEPDSFRSAKTEIPGRWLAAMVKRRDDAIVERVCADLRYLRILLCPAGLPKGWRRLSRRAVLAPAPKLRRRLR